MLLRHVYILLHIKWLRIRRRRRHEASTTHNRRIRCIVLQRLFQAGAIAQYLDILLRARLVRLNRIGVVRGQGLRVGRRLHPVEVAADRRSTHLRMQLLLGHVRADHARVRHLRTLD